MTEWISVEEKSPQCGDSIRIRYINLIAKKVEESNTEYNCCWPYGWGVEGVEQDSEYFYHDVNWDSDFSIQVPFYVIEWCPRE